MSDRGYGMFMHTSAPVTCDFGQSYIGANKLFMADEMMDIFVFFGEPKEILSAYTQITGRPEMPPLWSFGTWMSRITYFSEKKAAKSQKNSARTRFHPTLFISTPDGSEQTGNAIINLPKTGLTIRKACLQTSRKTDSILLSGSSPISPPKQIFPGACGKRSVREEWTWNAPIRRCGARLHKSGDCEMVSG